MIQTPPILSILRSATAAARIAMLAAGLSAASVAQAANCSDAPVSGHIYNIVNKDSGLQLDVAYSSQNIGADVVQWNAGTSTNQQWTLSDSGRGVWTMRAVHSQQALDLYQYSQSDNAPVKQYSYSGYPNQQWLLDNNNSDAYTIASNYSKLLLTVADKTPGRLLTQHSAQSGYALQRWYFNPVDIKCSASVNPAFSSFMGFNRILVGGDLDEKTWDPNNTTDTINKAPWDVRYSYIHSAPAPYDACYAKCDLGCKNAGWWGCWQMSSDGKWNTDPGTTITQANANNANLYKFQNGQRHQLIQQWTWYTGQDLGIAFGKLKQQWSGGDGKPDYMGAVNNEALLTSYLKDYRFFLNKIGAERNIIQLEPDFWGFLRETDPKNSTHPNDPHFMPAAVQKAGQNANISECAGEENSVAGLASCMIKMAHNLAKNSTVGLHMSCWDLSEADSAYRGPKACLSYYQKLGAGQGDFLSGESGDRDAKWDQITNNVDLWFNDVKFAQYLKVIKMMTEGVGKPMIIWQIALGNEMQKNYDLHWQDDKVKYFFTHMNDVAGAHIVALQFGAGENHQTGTATDGGYLLWYANDYYSKGGQPLK